MQYLRESIILLTEYLHSVETRDIHPNCWTVNQSYCAFFKVFFRILDPAAILFNHQAVIKLGGNLDRDDNIVNQYDGILAGIGFVRQDYFEIPPEWRYIAIEKCKISFFVNSNEFGLKLI